MESIATAVAKAHAAACERWPEFTIELSQFSDELTHRLGSETEPMQLSAIRTDDVYLAIACLNGDHVAIDHLERDYLAAVDYVGRKLDATDDQVAEVRSHFRQSLFDEEPGRACALAEFTGRSDLRSYLELIATHELVRVIGGVAREPPIELLLGELDLSRASDLGILYAEHGAEIDVALRAALEALDVQHRTLLGYSLVTGWSIDRIGEFYGVHRSTTVQWLTAARNTLTDQLQREIATRVPLPLEDLYAIVREVRSRINVSLLRIL
ncbi:MAG TPA: hypothetical protein VHN14_20570 [Kofleriaceae bacterium]|jgi:RNA polymerase sigma-70 factor (ECF subfamily)|nr:hypothetical protein [Kofleriaceae bacterium]